MVFNLYGSEGDVHGPFKENKQHGSSCASQNLTTHSSLF